MLNNEYIANCFSDCNLLLNNPERVNEAERIISALSLCCKELSQLDITELGDTQSVAQENLETLNGAIQSIGLKDNVDDQKNRVKLILNTIKLSERERHSIHTSINFFAYFLNIAKSKSELDELWVQILKREVVA